jgi:hypothetical protein
MRAIALAENIRTVKSFSRHVDEAKQDPSLEGVLVFCGISVVLTVLALVFSAMNLPSAYLL